jgi:thiamine-monophosphate kinase
MNESAEDRLLASLLRLVPVSGDGDTGPGDDCAAIAVGRGRLILLKTDCVAEGVHFAVGEDPARVGWKALCRPLSDIAAMGGVPGHALVTLFSPPGVDAAWWEGFYRGLGKAARRFGVKIAGGEMSRQPRGIAVSVALTGEVEKRNMVTRGGGRAGDLLYVTGRLGGSLGGHHLDFVPRLAEGRWLACTIHPRAMMDLSDGLGSDLPRLAAASGCGFEVDGSSIPRRRGCTLRQAVGDGEDYELLFAIDPRKARALERGWAVEFPRTPLARIGRLASRQTLPDWWAGGWDHFGVKPS